MNKRMTVEKYITDHCTKKMEKGISAEHFPLWKRSCESIDDVTIVRHGLLRCISVAHSGRHHLQDAEEIHSEIVIRKE